jgi:endoglycosylceramidase
MLSGPMWRVLRVVVPGALGIAALAVAVALGLGDGARDATTAGSYPQRLSTRGGQIVDTTGRPVLLRGFNVIPVYIGGPGQTWGPEHYRRIRARGFNAVRFVLYWHIMEPARGRFSAVNFRTLERAVGYARRARLYVILDAVHVYQGPRYIPRWARSGNTLADIERDAGGYVAELARRYRHNATVAAYDPINEPPTYPPDQNSVLRVYARLIEAIRRVDPDKIVMFEPSYGDAVMTAANLDLLGDTRNLVFSMHDYYSGGAGDGYLPNGEKDKSSHDYNHRGYPAPNPAELEQHLLVNLTRMRGAGIPVWIGEFGMDPNAPNAERWIRDKVALFKRHGLGYSWWLYGTDGAFATLTPEGRFKPFVRLLR